MFSCNTAFLILNSVHRQQIKKAQAKEEYKIIQNVFCWFDTLWINWIFTVTVLVWSSVACWALKRQPCCTFLPSSFQLMSLKRWGCYSITALPLVCWSTHYKTVLRLDEKLCLSLFHILRQYTTEATYKVCTGLYNSAAAQHQLYNATNLLLMERPTRRTANSAEPSCLI